MSTQPTATDRPTMHDCNPADPGRPLPFGRRDPSGQCPRCRELDEGAAPRTLNWVEDKRRRDEDQQQQRADSARNIAAGLCHCGKPKGHDVVCTAGDW
jgi:hypothetical protein